MTTDRTLEFPGSVVVRVVYEECPEWYIEGLEFDPDRYVCFGMIKEEILECGHYHETDSVWSCWFDATASDFDEQVEQCARDHFNL